VFCKATEERAETCATSVPLNTAQIRPTLRGFFRNIPGEAVGEAAQGKQDLFDRLSAALEHVGPAGQHKSN
jgi:hypothetical protein